MNTHTEVRSIFEKYWMAMFELLGWDYDHRPPGFEGWEPDFVLYGPRSVYVAVVPAHEFPDKAMDVITASNCPYEALIVTGGAPIPDAHGRDIKYSLGWARSRNTESAWHWHPALLGREGSSVLLRHHLTDLTGLTTKPIDESAAGRYIQTKWEQAKAQATGHALRLDPEQFEKEKDFQTHIIEMLAPHFYVYTKVRGRHFADKTIKRVDLIITPRDPSPWKDEKIIFGVEIKNPAALSQTNKITKWLGQCIDYANTLWEYSPDDGATWRTAGYIHIFACPGLIDSLPMDSDMFQRLTRGFVSRLMAQQGVGELKQTKYRGWSLVRNADHVIWSEANGVEDGRKDSVQRKFGSR